MHFRGIYRYFRQYYKYYIKKGIKLMGNIILIRDEYDLELIIGAIKKFKDKPASAGVELALRWDEDTLIRKHSSKVKELFYAREGVKIDKDLLKQLEKFLKISNESLKLIVDEFIEDAKITKIPDYTK